MAVAFVYAPRRQNLQRTPISVTRIHCCFMIGFRTRFWRVCNFRLTNAKKRPSWKMRYNTSKCIFRRGSQDVSPGSPQFQCWRTLGRQRLRGFQRRRGEWLAATLKLGGAGGSVIEKKDGRFFSKYPGTKISSVNL